jgi:excisionase family DNA binding protein
MEEHSKLMTTKEVAAYLKCHTSTIYKLLRQSRLPAFKVGSDYRFDIVVLETWSRQQAMPRSKPNLRVGRRKRVGPESSPGADEFEV